MSNFGCGKWNEAEEVGLSESEKKGVGQSENEMEGGVIQPESEMEKREGQ